MANSNNSKKYKVTSSNGKKTKGASSSKKTGKNTARQKQLPDAGVRFRHFIPLILIVLAILTMLSIFIKDFGVIGNFLRDNVLFGIFGGTSYVLPLILGACAVMMFSGQEIKTLRLRLVCTSAIFVLLSAILHIFCSSEDAIADINPIVHYNFGVAERSGGGFFGGFFGALMVKCFSAVGAVIIAIALILILILVLVGKTPRELYDDIAYKISSLREKSLAAKEEALAEDRYRAEQRRLEREERLKEAEAARARYENAAAENGSEKKSRKGVRGDGDIPPATVKRKVEIDPDITNGDYDEEEVQLQIDDVEDLDAFDEAMAESEASNETESTEGKQSVISPEFVAGADAELAEEDISSVFEDPEDEEVIRKLSRYYLGEDGADDGVIAVTEEAVLSVDEETREVLEESVPEKAYKLPDIDLLIAGGDSKKVDRSREIREKEERLIQTLERFNVHTKSAGAPAVGPTITRYELRPDPGTRVSSIVKLVDDIALSFATSGVRIEAPIPGKSAVGIEVPNSTREIVHLRDLIDTDTFRDAQSRLNVALGADVAGEPVYLDIPKMPHLLIAGATGMGKSVCINCILISLLYKATPDEVKLILIDPKKVEFSMYGDLPHLLVPVVSDPKKAAGALSWAVNEMERRFGLIDEVGVRNIFGYNQAVRDDPNKEKLPEIVIVIDELADLMMTAPDSVEDSVCRLAQKARAAGMHLIIGTQRPSVDVITGTIKGNIPSRIAFTVASQVDSRTIIDMGGAEKLIGKGDMLYSPVSATKPIRVQGALVSDEEVERVVSFIRNENADKKIGYSDDVITQIENEAAKCNAKKKGQSASVEVASGGEDEDPMFWKAVEIAIDSGKISTSLIQRKCSLGFGRAAKLIDRMEALKYVSAPDGQKPRQVLITREQYEQMRMGTSDTSAADDDTPF